MLHLWENGQKPQHWANAAGLRQTISPERGDTLKYLRQGRGDLRILVSQLTGHCRLQYHLNITGKAVSAICQFYSKKNETVEYVLTECEAVCGLRLQHLGRVRLEPKDVIAAAPGTILGYRRSLVINWDFYVTGDTKTNPLGLWWLGAITDSKPLIIHTYIV